MKIILTLLLFLFCLPSFGAKVLIKGTETGNGGDPADPCEEKMISVILDLEDWLVRDGHLGLDLEFENLKEISYETFKTKMMLAIKNIKQQGVICTTDKLYIGKTEKPCINQGHQIRCNLSRISVLKNPDLYLLYPHEVAGVAGIESNRGETSIYDFSKQVPKFLEGDKLAADSPSDETFVVEASHGPDVAGSVFARGLNKRLVLQKCLLNTKSSAPCVVTNSFKYTDDNGQYIITTIAKADNDAPKAKSQYVVKSYKNGVFAFGFGGVMERAEAYKQAIYECKKDGCPSRCKKVQSVTVAKYGIEGTDVRNNIAQLPWLTDEATAPYGTRGCFRITKVICE